eukprot:TRINITY_DN1027_c1_g1_i1.p1 TRINITY_DN1027_c1_g1~~TRINITY_DN1027_c1_g1_i1.p1  ORF type:complete len:456 (-),score=78.44 TRINITY_DN1027_c1_g1_i1:61-1428(-)
MDPSSSIKLKSAELRLGHTFDQKTWRRPLCIQAQTSDGSSITLADDSGYGRCEDRLLLATWDADTSAKAVSDADHCAQGTALSTWRQLEPSQIDPDEVRSVTEYFPLGPVKSSSRSFLRLRLAAADSFGDELIMMRSRDPATSSSTSQSAKSHASEPVLLRPSSLWETYCPSWARSYVLEALQKRTSSEQNLLDLWGVGVIHEDMERWEQKGDRRRCLQYFRELLSSPEARGTGFLPNAPWSQSWRVCGVEEHCRTANLGLWGTLFRLKHSVLAVRLRRCNNSNDLRPEAEIEAAATDLLYLDKNADIGVSWRREGLREKFSEVPREGYGFTSDIAVKDLWDAVISTDAFSEAQEVSNCQHFVKECLAELNARGHLKGSLSKGSGDFTLRNQVVADTLHQWGYLDKDGKAPPVTAVGMQKIWRFFLSWGSKVGAARWASPWAENFILRPVSFTVE